MSLIHIFEYRSTVEAQLLNYQNMAMRTLGFAFKIVGENEPNDCTELVLSLIHISLQGPPVMHKKDVRAQSIKLKNIN